MHEYVRLGPVTVARVAGLRVSATLPLVEEGKFNTLLSHVGKGQPPLDTKRPQDPKTRPRTRPSDPLVPFPAQPRPSTPSASSRPRLLHPFRLLSGRRRSRLLSAPGRGRVHPVQSSRPLLSAPHPSLPCDSLAVPVRRTATVRRRPDSSIAQLVR